MSEFADMFENNEALQPLTEAIESIMGIPDDSLTPETIEIVQGMFNGAFTNAVKEKTINGLLEEFEERNMTKLMVDMEVQNLHEQLNGFIADLKPSAEKEKLLHTFFDTLLGLYDEALRRYHNYTVELPLTLEDGARVPSYAYDTDAAADLYALNDTIVPAHSYGNRIHTGVGIKLPEGYMAMVFPRSSIGSKTALRLSNSVGIIDNGYTGEIGVLYDNIGDEDYTIHAGDRIAQLMIQPSYRFNPKVVKALEETDRNENGFGSSGK